MLTTVTKSSILDIAGVLNPCMNTPQNKFSKSQGIYWVSFKNVYPTENVHIIKSMKFKQFSQL